jgi:hypothetical protein
LITATGWTWEYIGEYMTIPRLDALIAYWDTFPPLSHSVNEIRQIIRAYFKIPDNRKRLTEGIKKEDTEEEFKQKFMEFGRLTGMIGNV